MAIRAIVGLGNPGREYVSTRHNVGFLFVEHLVTKLGGSKKTKGKLLESFEVKIGNHSILLVKPLTYMNRSGLAVRQVLESEHVERDEWLVVVDDLYLPVGALRYREGGSSAGQRGLQSIMEVFENNQVPRLRIGVGPCPADVSHPDFVLSTFSASERTLIDAAIDRGGESVILSIRQEIPLVVKADHLADEK